MLAAPSALLNSEPEGDSWDGGGQTGQECRMSLYTEAKAQPAAVARMLLQPHLALLFSVHLSSNYLFALLAWLPWLEVLVVSAKRHSSRSFVGRWACGKPWCLASRLLEKG